MKKSTRLLSLVIVAVLLFCTATVISAAKVAFTDVSNHWAWKEGYIPYLVEKNVLNGFEEPNGTFTFRPEQPVTRSQFIKMLDETFGLIAVKNINYDDVKSSDWFYPYVAKAAAQGYLLDYGTKLDPNGALSREEAISLLVRYLDLPANEKASTSVFKDYSSINDKYKDYILRAAYAKITNGSENGDGTYSFKPKDTLKRAEALTILYRAAGCIFNGTTYVRDAFAHSTNNVVTKGGVSLVGIKMTGRSIISEGATSGEVLLKNCTISGVLYIRGAAEVRLENTTADKIIVDNGTKITLVSKATVKNLIVNSRSNVIIHDNCTVQNMEVNYGADKTKVTGTGYLTRAVINADDFESSIMPVEFEIANNLTATFGGNPYSGSNDSQNSFIIEPFVTTENKFHQINFSSSIGGSVFYYYTNNKTTPTILSFETFYDTAANSARANFVANTPVTIDTFESSAVKNYKYVVIQIVNDGKKYAPVVIENTALDANFFAETPTLDKTTLSIKTNVSGTVYWYYVDNGSSIRLVDFQKTYLDLSSDMKGSLSASASRNINISLKSAQLSKYDYIAFSLKDYSGAYYPPVVVALEGNGFVSDPVVTTPGTIRLTTEMSGDLYYYYSKTNTLPSPAQFKAEYNAAGTRLNDTATVRANLPATISYDTTYSSNYPYLIMSIRNSAGEFTPPIALFIDYSTGFLYDPELYTNSRIRFKSEKYGYLKFYYTKSNTAPTIDSFNSTYSTTKSTYKGQQEITSKYFDYIDYSPAYAINYPYMAIMLVDKEGTSYTPVLVTLDVSENTGFQTLPKVSDGNVIFKTYNDGDVMYFYTRTQTILTPDDFEVGYEYIGANLRGSVEVTGGTTSSFAVDYEKLKIAPYIYVAFYNPSTEKFGFPILINVELNETESLDGSSIVLTSYSDRISMRAKANGTILLYTTNDSTIPTKDSFESKYEAATTRKQYSLNYNETASYTFGSEKYVVICLRDSSGNYGTPILINRQKGTIIDSVDDLLDNSTKLGTGIASWYVNKASKTIVVEPSRTGTVAFLVKSAGALTKIESKNFTVGGDTVSFDYGKFEAALSLLGANAQFYLQLTTAEGIYEALPISIY